MVKFEVIQLSAFLALKLTQDQWADSKCLFGDGDNTKNIGSKQQKWNERDRERHTDNPCDSGNR